MKICDLTQSYTANSGGVRTYIDAKRNYIQEKTNYQQILIVPGASDSVIQNDRLKTYHVKAPLIPKCEPYRFIYRLDKVFSILKTEQPDIIELGSAYTLPWAAFAFRRIHHCAVFGFYHTDFPTAYIKPTFTQKFGEKWGRRFEKYAKFYARLVYQKCNGTITASHIFEDKLKQFKIHNLKYLPLGIDAQAFHPRKRDAEFRKQLGLTDSDILLLYVGRFDSEKRIWVILDAFEKLPQPHHYSLMLVGDGPLRTSLMAKFAQNPRVHIFPYENHREKLARIFASADIYVTAGPHETFGLCVLEAQACGLPVVGVNAGALIERVSASVGRLGAVDSADEMAMNIHTIAQNGFYEKGKAARELVEAEYSWEKVFEQLFQYYRQIYHLTQKKNLNQRERIYPPLFDLSNYFGALRNPDQPVNDEADLINEDKFSEH